MMLHKSFCGLRKYTVSNAATDAVEYEARDFDHDYKTAYQPEVSKLGLR